MVMIPVAWACRETVAFFGFGGNSTETATEKEQRGGGMFAPLSLSGIQKALERWMQRGETSGEAEEEADEKKKKEKEKGKGGSGLRGERVVAVRILGPSGLVSDQTATILARRAGLTEWRGVNDIALGTFWELVKRYYSERGFLYSQLSSEIPALVKKVDLTARSSSKASRSEAQTEGAEGKGKETTEEKEKEKETAVVLYFGAFEPVVSSESPVILQGHLLRNASDPSAPVDEDFDSEEKSRGERRANRLDVVFPPSEAKVRTHPAAVARMLNMKPNRHVRIDERRFRMLIKPGPFLKISERRLSPNSKERPLPVSPKDLVVPGLVSLKDAKEEVDRLMAQQMRKGRRSKPSLGIEKGKDNAEKQQKGKGRRKGISSNKERESESPSEILLVRGPETMDTSLVLSVVEGKSRSRTVGVELSTDPSGISRPTGFFSVQDRNFRGSARQIALSIEASETVQKTEKDAEEQREMPSGVGTGQAAGSGQGERGKVKEKGGVEVGGYRRGRPSKGFRLSLLADNVARGLGRYADAQIFAHTVDGGPSPSGSGVEFCGNSGVEIVFHSFVPDTRPLFAWVGRGVSSVLAQGDRLVCGWNERTKGLRMGSRRDPKDKQKQRHNSGPLPLSSPIGEAEGEEGEEEEGGVETERKPKKQMQVQSGVRSVSEGQAPVERSPLGDGKSASGKVQPDPERLWEGGWSGGGVEGVAPSPDDLALNSAAVRADSAQSGRQRKLREERRAERGRLCWEFEGASAREGPERSSRGVKARCSALFKWKGGRSLWRFSSGLVDAAVLSAGTRTVCGIRLPGSAAAWDNGVVEGEGERGMKGEWVGWKPWGKVEWSGVQNFRLGDAVEEQFVLLKRRWSEQRMAKNQSERKGVRAFLGNLPMPRGFNFHFPKLTSRFIGGNKGQILIGGVRVRLGSPRPPSASSSSSQLQKRKGKGTGDIESRKKKEKEEEKDAETAISGKEAPQSVPEEGKEKEKKKGKEAEKTQPASFEPACLTVSESELHSLSPSPASSCEGSSQTKPPLSNGLQRSQRGDRTQFLACSQSKKAHAFSFLREKKMQSESVAQTRTDKKTKTNVKFPFQTSPLSETTPRGESDPSSPSTAAERAYEEAEEREKEMAEEKKESLERKEDSQEGQRESSQSQGQTGGTGGKGQQRRNRAQSKFRWGSPLAAGRRKTKPAKERGEKAGGRIQMEFQRFVFDSVSGVSRAVGTFRKRAFRLLRLQAFPFEAYLHANGRTRVAFFDKSPLRLLRDSTSSSHEPPNSSEETTSSPVVGVVGLPTDEALWVGGETGLRGAPSKIGGPYWADAAGTLELRLPMRLHRFPLQFVEVCAFVDGAVGASVDCSPLSLLVELFALPTRQKQTSKEGTEKEKGHLRERRRGAPGLPSAYATAGAGVRFSSPFGLCRLDLGSPLLESGDLRGGSGVKSLWDVPLGSRLKIGLESES
uniref:Uncharacterized protein n=1 Tax=Chromera velia CCMP2878 TaxID=1169474 RepID=A0A0G4HP43_9ALVE|eukprot:Cvel_7714.t1-p1 / transcript=Cvel_7714.t1 / gene=Cvel_7714 / organism=Chromera_velia_CCMP2878 / gene_product=hypothetical protein / transcript_product=hypothetical protein / location=Cvel_scaffold410:2435-11736(-) / protein_length=1445 / sequence_SO=supercontig / SO=protein_coding / is_pseudo=false